MAQDATPPDQQPRDPAGGCLIRMFWMILGNLLLIFSAAAILRSRAPLAVSYADVIYGLTVLGMIAARYVDVRYLGGRTSDGEQPATMGNWRRYSIVLAVVTLAVWVLLHVVAHYRA